MLIPFRQRREHGRTDGGLVLDFFLFFLFFCSQKKKTNNNKTKNQTKQLSLIPFLHPFKKMATQKKIIILWVHPRSLSTVFEPAMGERGDLTVIHEPFGYLFYVGEKRAEVPNFHVDPSHPITYEGIKQMILNKVPEEGKKHIFVKDMAFHCQDHVLLDEDFIRQCEHTFIIRDPVKGVASHFEMNNKVTIGEIGYDAQYRLFEAVRRITGKTPAVVDADELQKDPENVLKEYAVRVGLETARVSTEWQPGVLDIWQPWLEWHLDAARSSAFRPPSGTDKHRQLLNDNPHLLEYVAYHQPFYDKLAENKILARTNPTTPDSLRRSRTNSQNCASSSEALAETHNLVIGESTA